MQVDQQQLDFLEGLEEEEIIEPYDPTKTCPLK
jgi:hypothetical protein